MQILCLKQISNVLSHFIPASFPDLSGVSRFKHMPLPATNSCSLFEALTFHLVSHKIFFVFRWEAQSSNLLKPKKCQPHFLISNKIQNIRQHHFETNKGLIFDYMLIQNYYCKPTWKVTMD